MPVTGGDHQGDLEVGEAEDAIIAHAPRLPWPAASVEALHGDGVVLVPHALSTATTATLRAHLESKLSASLASVASGAISESDQFGPVLCRKHRHDLKLALEPAVADALAEALQALGPFIRGALECEEPLLTELGGIRSTEGAPRQPVHRDLGTGFSRRPSVLTAFVALQDIDEEMGPTTFWPGTHTDPQAHAAIRSGKKKAKLLREHPIRLGTMPGGSSTLYNVHLLHAGGANKSSRCRWLLYMSFAPGPERFSVAHLDLCSRMCQLGVHKLGELERGAVRSEDNDETKRLKEMWTALADDDELKRYRHVWKTMDATGMLHAGHESGSGGWLRPSRWCTHGGLG